MQTLHDKIVAAANILESLKTAQIDTITLEAFSLACELESEFAEEEFADAQEFLAALYDSQEDGESQYSEDLLDSVKELLFDPEAYSFIKSYCEGGAKL